MAKQAKATDAAKSGGVNATDLKRVVTEISRQKGRASEAAGLAGKATQQAVEQYGLEKTALTFARRISDMEEGKRQGVIRASIEYWHKLGLLDQIDMFDDLIPTLEEIVQRAHNQRGAKQDPVVAQLVT